MRIVCLLLAVSVLPTFAQSPQELLQLTEQTYKSPAGYTINGEWEALRPGTSTPVAGDITVALLPQALQAAKPHGPAVRPGLRPDPSNKNLSLTWPPEVLAGWERLAENVLSVSEKGGEQLPMNGAPVACRILEVTYKPHPYLEGHDSPVTYSICSDQHVILKKSLAASADRKGTEAPAQWTLTFTSVHFGVAPDWLLASQTPPALNTRQEWIGRPAPDFTLSILDGKPAKLSAMHGKVVLLDFWAINCLPCIHSLPSMQVVDAAYRSRKVVTWSVAMDKPEMSKKWLLTHADTLPILNDPDFTVSDLYKVQGIPAVVLVGRDGKIKNYWQGEVPQQELEAALDQALHS